MRSQKGYALPIALASLALMTLVAIPVVRMTTGTAAVSGVEERYSAEAGIDDGIARLLNGDFDDELIILGDTTSYDLPYEINGETPSITITKGYGVLAREEFESGDWAGGTGWADAWAPTGSSSVLMAGTPHGGQYHALLNGSVDRIERSLDISSAGGYDILVQFWGKAKSFQNEDTMEFLISPDGETWETAVQWVNGDDDNLYRFYSVDIPSGYTDTLHIAWQASTGGSSSYFYLDDIIVFRTSFADSGQEPRDDFESRDWQGGVYWLSPWQTNGNVSNTPSRFPYEGERHVEINGPLGSYIERTADLSRLSAAKLTFYAKSSHISLGDEVDCKISTDGVDWYSARMWTVDDNDLDYFLVKEEIPIEYLGATTYIRFESIMSSPSDHFNFDLIKILGRIMVYEIVSTVGNVTTTAIVTVSDAGEVEVLFWYTEVNDA
jgi:hypothetical protein